MTTSFPFVQSKAISGVGSLAFDHPVQYGNIIIAVFCIDKYQTGLPGCTDSLGNYYQLYAQSSWVKYPYNSIVQIWVGQGQSSSIPFGGVKGGSCTVTFSGYSGGSVGNPSILIAEYSTSELYQIVSCGGDTGTDDAPSTGQNLDTADFRAIVNNGNIGGSHCSDTGDGHTGSADPNGILSLQLTPQDGIPERTDNNVAAILMKNFPLDVQMFMANFNSEPTSFPLGYFTSTGNIRATTVQAGAIAQAAIADLDFPYLNGPLVAQCNKFPTGCVGSAYPTGYGIVAGGGTSPYTFVVVGGIFPPGLSLDGSTGLVSGTPSAAGTFQFDVKITDSVGAFVFVTCTIVICTCGGGGNVVYYSRH